jgi:hypothetical protein
MGYFFFGLSGAWVKADAAADFASGEAVLSRRTLLAADAVFLVVFSFFAMISPFNY